MTRPSLPAELRDILERYGFVKPTPAPTVDALQRGISRRHGEVTVSSRSSGSSLARVSLDGRSFEGLADDPAMAIIYALTSALQHEQPALPGMEFLDAPEDVTSEDVTPDRIVSLLGPEGEGMDIRLDDQGNYVNSAGDMIDDQQMKWVRLEAFKVLNRREREANEQAAEEAEPVGEHPLISQFQTPSEMYADAGPEDVPEPPEMGPDPVPRIEDDPPPKVKKPKKVKPLIVTDLPDEPVDELGRQLKAATDAALLADAGPLPEDDTPPPDPDAEFLFPCRCTECDGVQLIDERLPGEQMIGCLRCQTGHTADEWFEQELPAQEAVGPETASE